ncbi:MAG: hypothetical protein OEW16_11930 [Gammaproteobacteria bacterium]|nr:hypothetical protein [Gammaproteobacteria bacterium]
MSHLYAPDEAYFRVFEYLESAINFFYKNCSTPDAPPRSMERETLKEDLRRQISESEIVIILSDLFGRDPILIEFQALYAKSSEKPVLVMEPFGTGKPVPKELSELADDVVGWNTRDVSDKIRQQARHEDTTRWDVIEFKLD